MVRPASSKNLERLTIQHRGTAGWNEAVFAIHLRASAACFSFFAFFFLLSFFSAEIGSLERDTQHKWPKSAPVIRLIFSMPIDFDMTQLLARLSTSQFLSASARPQRSC